jgi:hypothetical protein
MRLAIRIVAHNKRIFIPVLSIIIIRIACSVEIGVLPCLAELERSVSQTIAVSFASKAREGIRAAAQMGGLKRL